jgi:rhodanese-related sulfurtransferase
MGLMSLGSTRALLAALLTTIVVLGAGCGEDSAATPAEAGTQPAQTATDAGAATAVTLLAPDEAQELVAGGDVRVLDVRTPEEFAEGHVAGATLIDFYEPDFAERIAALDRDATYVVYCRSGNRSGQATALMAEQGFSAVHDVDGGVLAWEAAGLPLAR